MTHALLSIKLFSVLIVKLALEGALRVGVRVYEACFGVKDEGAQLERAAKVVQSQRVNDAF